MQEDRFGRDKFTGRSILAVTADRPPDYIKTILERLPGLIPPFEFEGEERLRRTDVYPGIGAAIVPFGFEVVRGVVEGNPDALSGVVVGRERYLYLPAKLDVDTSVVPLPPLEAMGVNDVDGGNVKVLILDSGIDTTHPDFLTRGILPLQFSGAGTNDTDGHGTRMTGVSCGPRQPYLGPRYGVASDATIVCGKVMNTATDSAADCDVLCGLEYAAASDVVVVNMSFGASVDFDEPFDSGFEEVAKRILDGGVLMVAAAGNDPEGTTYPVEHPANCPSVMAVAGLDENLLTWDLSCGGVNDGQDIDVSAPGYEIRSCEPNSTYANKSGTSESAAFVTGIAALWASTPGKPRGNDLWCAITKTAKRVPNGRPREVGAGLVQAPPPN
jgi:subtilisin family serine protease